MVDESSTAWSLHHLRYVALGEGDAEAAYALFEESLIARELEDRYNTAEALQGLGRTALYQRDYGAARTRCSPSVSLTNLRKASIKDRIDVSLDALASLAHLEQHGLRAARLWGAATCFREGIGSPRPPVDQEKYDRETGQARAALREAAFATAFEEARDLTLGRAVERAG